MSDDHPVLDVDAIVDAAATGRARRARRNARRALAVSVAVTVVWAVYVTGWGHWERVVDNWVASLTMTAGSFVAGATPQGGGAVAFPVFTKALDIPSEVARTFSLCIQTVGMGAATLAILLRRRRIETRALAIALPFAVTGFLIGYFALSDRSELFAPSVLPGAYVKVGFTLLVVAMAYVIHLAYRVHVLEVRHQVSSYTPRFVACLAGCALFGGLASSQVGSGSDVLLYLALVVLAGLSPRVGVPTSVVLMASISLLGFVLIGVIDGQLDITLSSRGVTSVGGAETLPALDPGRFDLFGLWIAAVPVVAWGAPLGAWATSKVTDRQLVAFVVALAGLEAVTTVVFVDELHSDPALVAFAVVGLVVMVVGLGWVQRNRVRLLRLEPLRPDATFSRSDLDLGPRYAEQLADDRAASRPDHHGLGGE